MKRLAIIGYYGASIGLYRVVRELARRFDQEIDISYIALLKQGEPFRDGRITVYPAAVEFDEVTMANYMHHLLLYRIQPDVIILYRDLLNINFYLPALLPFRKICRLMAYLPLDGEVEDVMGLLYLAHFHSLVFFTDYHRRQFREKMEEAFRQTDTDIPLPSMSVIPHGVDPDRFHPVDPNGVGRRRPRSLKERAFPDYPFLHDAFIVLNGNRNYNRKRLADTIRGFAEFARDKSDVYLYLHTPGDLPDSKEEVRAWCEQWGVGDKVVIPDNVVSLEQLNLIYNACEVGVNTCIGEGWGLVSCEHAATGGAQIITGLGNLKEIWEDGACFLEPTETIREGEAYYSYRRADIQQLSAALNCLYHNPGELCDASHRALAQMRKPRFWWNAIAEMWEGEFRSAAGRSSPPPHTEPL